MTILTHLTDLYERMQQTGEAPKRGFSSEKISYELVIDKDGTPLRLSSIQQLSGKKPAPRVMSVPMAVKRSSGIKPNLFWDKSAYVLGVTALENEEGEVVASQGKRTAQEHQAFVDAHLELLEGAKDEGLTALVKFLQGWHADRFTELVFPPEALDENIVFRLEGDVGADGAPRFLHDRPAVLPYLSSDNDADAALCLVTGEQAPIARLHPSIKGVMGAQSSGAALVSFNGEPYESFGKEQGSNAPVSEYAAFAYGAALNALLAKGSHRSLRIGDATVVFWAKAATHQASSFAEMLLGQALSPPTEQDETNKLRASLMNIALGRDVEAREFDPSTKVFVLGLAPNAARVSVRFWYMSGLQEFAANIARFWGDLALEPSGFKGPPAAWALLYETALQRKAENIPPLLGGALMQAVLHGKPLPRTMLSAIMGRIRAEGDINGRRVAIMKAVINRRTREEIPVSLDRESSNSAYRLGRLFALLERAQSAALPGLNATIKDRYFGAASATPARVFPLLMRTANHHLSGLKKGEGSGLGYWLEREIGEVWLGLSADLPRTLTLEDQGRFCAGYYHQRWSKNDKVEQLEENEVVHA
ncbi:type I-C CRISPR-associated protein Cas8c/Csd1 [Rhodobacteraceae bacterium RKSG542]|uniref:type I-C CRISPR-associated protein Cas8c/Csd1 n=1 Tax=Pseudovibrio flavus TaxID=2529854 RepID=UPI0012BB890E|nr:type I-C CRISPR-associated protein Cas8c/Csd1 [Pseudovibrio flavus]MTI15919.1 type I-C CRISPR-associated protein Cas8c/Csd1 [Pseudovibrio flavus]